MSILYCLIYLAMLGLTSFIVGRILPKKWFRYDRFPYRTYKWEDDGRIYRKMNIQKWQDRVPDMSKLFKKLMPAKKLEGDFVKSLPLMIEETCVAEFIHALLAVAGFGQLFIFPGIGGVICSILYMLGNIPFILIQRYNRPRLVKTMLRHQKKEENT